MSILGLLAITIKNELLNLTDFIHHVNEIK